MNEDEIKEKEKLLERGFDVDLEDATPIAAISMVGHFPEDIEEVFLHQTPLLAPCLN